MKKIKISKQTKEELSKQQQSKINGGYVTPNCSCACALEQYTNTKNLMEAGGV